MIGSSNPSDSNRGSRVSQLEYFTNLSQCFLTIDLSSDSAKEKRTNLIMNWICIGGWEIDYTHAQCVYDRGTSTLLYYHL